MDIRDRGMRELFERERPDAVVHLAFVLNPIRDEHTMYDIDVNGTQNVLEAASAAGVQQLLVASSTTAYGAFPDNPVPLTEEHPVRGLPAYEYARDKTEIDRLCQLWAAQHPDRVMTIVRPTIVFGPNVDNYIVRFWLTARSSRCSTATTRTGSSCTRRTSCTRSHACSASAAAGSSTSPLTARSSSRRPPGIAGVKVRKMPLRVYRRIAAAAWRLRLPNVEAPPGQIDFLLYPWIAANDKLKAELDWTPRYTSRETFELTMRAKGKGAGAGETSGSLESPVPAPPPPRSSRLA